jgi:acyl-coenzyme A synthetase/AMP-(fatty) acid ligase
MVLDQIFAHAARAPQATAIVHCGAAVSYADLAAAVRTLAAFFKAQGVKAGAVSIVCVDSLLDSWFVLLGLRACGVTTLATHTPEVAADVRLGAIGCIVTTEAEKHTAALTLARKQGWREIVVPNAIGALAAKAQDISGPEGGHLLVTSGTTGRYKLVYRGPSSNKLRSERHVTEYKIGGQTWQYFGAAGPWAAGSYGRVLSVWSLGGVCVFEQRKDKIAEFLKLPVTDAKLTVSDLALLLKQMPSDAPRRDDLRIQIVGGAAPWALVEQVRARITTEIYNNLSSTEASGIASTRLEKPGDQQWYSIFPSRVVEVVDDEDRPVPPGVIGRLRVKMLEGDENSYWGDEELSKEVFRDGFFYSGDLALFGPDGRLALQGRARDVIPIYGGEKIATTPIEQDLQTALGSTGVALFATPNAARGEDDFHIAIEAQTPPNAQMLSLLIKKLPIPHAHVHVLEMLPRNAMGKIDRIALRALYGAKI